MEIKDPAMCFKDAACASTSSCARLNAQVQEKKKKVENLRRRYINTGGSSWRRRAWIPALQPQQMCRWVEDTSRLALGSKLQPGGKNDA